MMLIDSLGKEETVTIFLKNYMYIWFWYQKALNSCNYLIIVFCFGFILFDSLWGFDHLALLINSNSARLSLSLERSPLHFLVLLFLSPEGLFLFLFSNKALTDSFVPSLPSSYENQENEKLADSTTDIAWSTLL